jgi:hypothetical protein
MGEILDIEEIKRDATGRLDVVKKTEELQLLVDDVYPGFRVVLAQDPPGQEIRQRTRNVSPDVVSGAAFAALSGIEQMQLVMDDNGEPLELHELYGRLAARGGRMSLATMMSLLSKYKNQGKFHRFRRGIWGLPGQALLTVTRNGKEI